MHSVSAICRASAALQVLIRRLFTTRQRPDNPVAPPLVFLRDLALEADKENVTNGENKRMEEEEWVKRNKADTLPRSWREAEE